MTKKILLVVEDNADIRDANRRMLELNGYAVMTAGGVEEARRAAAERRPDLAVLDIMLPDGSGLDLCGELRGRYAGVPILFLTVLGENSDVLAGLRSGGDDYLTKPYDYDILLARIEALLRRAGSGSEPSAVGPFCFDHTAQRVYRDGEDVLLKPREYALFLLLARNPGSYFRPETLYRLVWAAEPGDDMRTVYTHVCGLRKKLGLTGGDRIVIERKRGKGYRLIAR